MLRSIITSLRPASTLLTVLFIMMLCWSTTASALDLHTARSEGLAGETDSGLLAIPPDAANDAQPLIITVNAQRTAEYTRIATRNGISMDVVGAMMFEKIYPTLPAGTWVRINGSWSKK